MFNDYLQAHPRSGAVAIVLIYLLAVADALLVPGAILWWLWKQPLHSGPFGVTGAVVMTIWAGKRIAHALFEFDTYEWMIAKLAKWAVMLGIIGVIAKAWVMAAK